MELKITLLVWWASVLSFTLFSHAARSPNFIVLFGDDVAWGDLGANWNPNKTESDTPNLDKLAESGIRFTDFHAAASVCSPSRASLLTARLGIRNGVTKLYSASGVAGLPLNETTFAEVFKAAGYNTAMIGKWHLGLNGSYHPLGRGFDYYYGVPFTVGNGCTDHPGLSIPVQTPCRKDPLLQIESFVHKGFDYYLGVPMSVDEGCCDHPGLDIPKRKSCKKDSHTFKINSLSISHECEMDVCDNSASWALPLLENRTIIEQPTDLWSLSDKYSRKAVELVKQMGSSDQPFLLYLAFAHMHVPLGHSAKYNTSARGFYGDTVREMDGIVGDVMAALRTNGLENDTVVWFTADNGPWVSKCQYSGSQGDFTGKWQETTGGGGSTAKLTPWEAGHREPAIVSWPGQIKPGQVSDSLLSTMDIFPTMAAIAGLDMPPNRKFDGIDISDVIFHGKRIYEGRAMFHPNSMSAGTTGDINTYRVGKYKAMYITGQSLAAASACGGKRGHVQNHDPPLIFNIQDDPAESTPLDSSSEEYQTALKQIQAAAAFIKNDIATDNTTVANYNTDPSCRPCCNPKHVGCRCLD